jgi:serine protease Do
MDLKTKEGVFVSSVVPDGPGADAGLKAEDVIVSFNGKPVKDSNELRFAVAGVSPGTRADVEVLRDGRSRTFTVKLGEYPDNPQLAGEQPGSSDKDLGLTVEPLTPDVARQFDLEDSHGLVVTEVEPGGPAEDAGLRPGDVLTRVNRQDVDSIGEYNKALDATPQGKPVLLQVERQGNTFFIALRPETKK